MYTDFGSLNSRFAVHYRKGGSTLLKLSLWSPAFLFYLNICWWCGHSFKNCPALQITISKQEGLQALFQTVPAESKTGAAEQVNSLGGEANMQTRLRAGATYWFKDKCTRWMERLAALESGLQVAASWASLLCVYIEFFYIFLGGGGGNCLPWPAALPPCKS